METTRQNKISRLLQKELSEIFLLQTSPCRAHWYLLVQFVSVLI